MYKPPLKINQMLCIKDCPFYIKCDGLDRIVYLFCICTPMYNSLDRYADLSEDIEPLRAAANIQDMYENLLQIAQIHPIRLPTTYEWSRAREHYNEILNIHTSNDGMWIYTEGHRATPVRT